MVSSKQQKNTAPLRDYYTDILVFKFKAMLVRSIVYSKGNYEMCLEKEENNHQTLKGNQGGARVETNLHQFAPESAFAAVNKM